MCSEDEQVAVMVVMFTYIASSIQTILIPSWILDSGPSICLPVLLALLSGRERRQAVQCVSMSPCLGCRCQSLFLPPAPSQKEDRVCVPVLELGQ